MGVIWPTTLPQTFHSRYSETPPDNTLRHDPDEGAALVRKKSTKAVGAMSGIMEMTSAQVDILDAFYNTYGGFTEISFPHPRTGASCTVRMVSPPKYDGKDGSLWWDVSVAFEVLV